MSPRDDAPVALGSAAGVLLATVTRVEDAERVTEWLARRHPGERAVLLVSGDVGDAIGPVLGCLAPVVAEIVFFDAVTPPHLPGDQLALAALEQHRIGQDFVFTVTELDDAVDFAVARVAPDDDAHWEGRRVLVVGPAAVLERAKQHLP